MKLDLNSLIKLLNEKGLKPIFQKENNVVYVEIKVKGHDIAVFYAIISEGNLLQQIVYLPVELIDKVKGEVARLLHFLNKEIDMPGFGMDETQKLVFYRSVIPSIDGEIPDRLFELYLATAKVVLDTFLNAILLVSSGMSTLDQLIKDKNEADLLRY